MLLGAFKIETGVLEYCNAGYNPPLVRTSNKGFYYFHAVDPYPPLGTMSDVIYTGDRLKLLPEGIFFLYSDGITEPMSINEVQVYEEKLLDVLL